MQIFINGSAIGSQVPDVLTDADLVREIHELTTQSLAGLFILPAYAIDYLSQHLGTLTKDGGWNDALTWHMVQWIGVMFQ